MGVTIRQIAEEAGVSRGTVDRVLNQRGRVRPEVEKRVKAIADELGYRPNLIGRALGMNKNRLKIGVIMQAAETAFMKEVAKGVSAAADEVSGLGGTVIKKKINGINVPKVLQTMEAMRAEGVHAIALMPVEDPRIKEAINRFVEEYNIPIVTFNSDIEGTKRLCFVGQNAVNCGRTSALLMGQYLKGREGTVAVISGFETNTSLSNRVKGFKEIMSQQFPEIEILDTEYCKEDEGKAEQITRMILKNHPNLKGIYVTCFGEAGICKVIQEYHKEEIIMISNDLMGKNYNFLEQGIIDLLVGQEGKVQGAEPILILHRLLFNNESPAKEYNFTDIVIKTRHNM